MIVTENSTIYFLIIVLSPFLGLLMNFLFFKKKETLGARISSFWIWIGFISALIGWFLRLPFLEKNESFGFVANEISWLIATLVLFVSGIVHHFSLRYMAGDRNYRRYFLFLSLITVSTLLMVASDNIMILIFFWSLSNLILTLLMMHKFEWVAAKNSGILTIKTFLSGLVFLGIGIGILAYECRTLSLHFIVQNSLSLLPSIRVTSLFFIILAAFTQSGCFPFHRWLISSLNSPTPVSAFMHAGLINGGGLLLARFALVFLPESFVLNFLFALAVISLILGGIWKLIQTDIKRMLACSTMTQMGFMMMQCALGLFPAALAHLCWHGLFKAFLFLKSGSTILEHRCTNEERVSNGSTFFLSSLCGLIGAIGFTFGSDLTFNFVDTTFVLIFFSWMASTQFAHTLLQNKKSFFWIISAVILCLVTGVIYGLTINLIEIVLTPMQISQPKTLNFVYLIGLGFVFCIWILINLKPFSNYDRSFWWRRFYVKMLNASQPDPKTVTSKRNQYKF